MKITRVIVYEGDEQWLRATIARSISEAVVGPGRAVREVSLTDDAGTSLDWPHVAPFGGADPAEASE